VSDYSTLHSAGVTDISPRYNLSSFVKMCHWHCCTRSGSASQKNQPTCFGFLHETSIYSRQLRIRLSTKMFYWNADINRANDAVQAYRRLISHKQKVNQ